jgi:hypothetical protein
MAKKKLYYDSSFIDICYRMAGSTWGIYVNIVPSIFSWFRKWRKRVISSLKYLFRGLWNQYMWLNIWFIFLQFFIVWGRLASTCKTIVVSKILSFWDVFVMLWVFDSFFITMKFIYDTLFIIKILLYFFSFKESKLIK